MRVTARLLLVTVVCAAGCLRKLTPLQRYMQAADAFVMAYTNENPTVSERAIRDHMAFFLGEMERFGSKNYELGYAYATERLARACERKGATNEAHTLRRALAGYVSTMHTPQSTGDVANAVSILDGKMGKQAGESSQNGAEIP